MQEVINRYDRYLPIPERVVLLIPEGKKESNLSFAILNDEDPFTEGWSFKEREASAPAFPQILGSF